MNTKIVVDSSASLYTLQGVDFECVPLKIITDDAEYLDNGTMDALGMAQTLRTYKGKTSTSCPNVSDWLAAYEGADEVYAITITGTLSGSYNAAQLAMPKAIRGIPNFTDITPAQLTDIRTAFAEAGIEISVLSCYQDLSNPDTAIRENAVAAVCRALHYQKAVGAKHVGSESACRDLTEDEKAATLPLLTDSILRIVEQAAKIDACFALEPVFVHTLGTVEKLRTLKEAVADHDHFHIIFDPVNVLTAADVSRQAAFWPAWCEVIGKDLACVHVKDAVFHPDAPRTPTALGAGQMDYTVIREWLHRDHPDAALLRDEVILPAAQADLAYIKAL